MFELQLVERQKQKYLQSLTPPPYNIEVYQWGFEKDLLVKFFLHHQYIGRILVKDFSSPLDYKQAIKEFIYTGK